MTGRAFGITEGFPEEIAKPLPTARVVWYVTGRFYEDEHNLLQDLGYFLYFAGAQKELFKENSIGEATALLTFRSEPFQAQSVTNGNISIGLDAAGSFSIYHNPAEPCPFGHGRISRWTIFPPSRVKKWQSDGLESPRSSCMATGWSQDHPMTRTHEKVSHLPDGKRAELTPDSAARAVENALELLEGRWKLSIQVLPDGLGTIPVPGLGRFVELGGDARGDVRLDTVTI